MTHIKKFAAAILITGIASASTGAQAQTALTNGATVSATTNGTVTRTGPVNNLDLSLYGTTYVPTTTNEGSFNLVSRTPTIQSINGTDVSLSFTGTSGVWNNGDYLRPTSSSASTNYLMAAAGSVNIEFSSAQNYFATRWGSIDLANNLTFYNGAQLVTSINGADMRSILGVNTHATAVAEFSFAEAGFTRVVATGTNYYMDFDQVSFASGAVDVAPIPLNAASLGGLMSFLMMLAMRGKGGTQVAIHMAFASLMPRRRTLA
jgi:hypothetical protein